MSDNSGGPLHRLWQACLLLLLSAVALVVAVKLLLSIWLWLLVGLLLLLICSGIALWWRLRQRRW